MSRPCVTRRFGLGVVLLATGAGACAASPGAPAAVPAVAEAASQALAADGWRTLGDPVFRNMPLPASMQGTAVVQAPDGFIWLGSQTGLLRWDGYRFRTFSADPNTPGALEDSYVQALHVDRQGRLWVGTSAGGLARMDTARERFTVIGKGPRGLSHVGVTAIADDAGGGLWVGTGAGLDHLDADGTTVRRHADGPGRHGLPARDVTALTTGRDGALWVGTSSGVFVRPAGAADFQPVPLGDGAGAPPTISRLLADSAGRVWIGTRAHGAFVAPAGRFAAAAVLDSQSVGAAGLQGDTVFGLVEARPDEVWLGVDGGGIVRVDTRDGTTRRIRHHDRTPASLPDDDIGSLFRDRSGLVWACSNSGLSIADPADRGISTWLGYEKRPDGITALNVVSVLAQPDGSAWLGLGDGGIDIVDPRHGRVGQLRPDAAHPLAALPRGRVLSMARAAGGEVYVGTQQGLYVADAAGRRIERLDVPGRVPTVPTWSLLVDGDRLWVGGLDGLRSVRRDARGALALVDTVDATTFGDQRITSLAAAGAGRLWVGTRAGLVRYDPATRHTERLRQDGPARVGLPAGFISNVFTDRRGRLWVASFGTGVRVVEPGPPGVAPVVRRIGMHEGLPNEGVNGIALDGNGDVWASTDDGLARIDGDTLAVTPLHVADGVGIVTYWTNAVATTPSGQILFGGNGGLTIVDARRVRPWTYQAPLVVTELDLGAGREAGARPDDGVHAYLELDARRRHLQVEFAALDYSSPETLRYAYRLAGYDRDWIATDPTRRLASYTNLPPGDYTLELRGSNREGRWSPPLQWPVRVLPAWYETGWFRVVAMLGGLLLVLGVVQGRTVVLRRRQHVLEALVARRTAELEQRSAELRESERRLEQMAYYDGLTGLPNRRLFTDDLKRLLALAQRGDPFTLLLIDLDRFKEINDTEGHDAGDALLMAVAGRLQRAVREIDRVARLGGDEFAVLLARTADRAVVESICRRIVESLCQPVAHRAGALCVTASIGVAACVGDGGDGDELYKAADIALYEVKRSGRNDWRWAAAGPG